jgi:hypothetical protein
MPARTDILSEIARLRRRNAEAPLRAEQQALARILDDLDVMGGLETVRKQRFSPKLCHGPKPVYGLTPHVWIGAVLWHHPAGYFGYKTLTLLGVWALHQDEKPMIAVGTKHAAFAHPFFDPESYHKLIQRDYTTYYKEDGSPLLDDSTLLITLYDPVERLQLRDEVQRQLATFT